MPIAARNVALKFWHKIYRIFWYFFSFVVVDDDDADGKMNE